MLFLYKIEKTMKTFILFFMLFCSCSLFAQNNGINFNQNDNNYIITPDNFDINVYNNFTFEFWMQPVKIVGDWITILDEGKCNNDSFSYYVAISPDSNLTFRFTSDGVCNSANNYICNTKIIPGTCIQVAISYSSVGVKIYYNGLLQPGHFTYGSYSGNLNISSESLIIGAYKSISGALISFHYGLLDELRIWSRVLSPSEILANYQSPIIGNETGLKLYYKFDSNITGPGMTVTNYATATGSSLNGLTYSNNAASPNTTYSCFNYTEVDNNLLESEEISIFPNPTNGIFMIKSNNSINEIKIYNMLGENTKDISNCEQMKSIEIDLSYYPRGIYFVKIYDEKTILTKKIIIN